MDAAVSNRSSLLDQAGRLGEFTDVGEGRLLELIGTVVGTQAGSATPAGFHEGQVDPEPGFREAVPGRNVSSRALTFAATLSALLVVAITIVTNAASPTIVPVGRGLRYWMECVAGPMAIGAPFMTVATLMALRAFPTRPAIAGALCGASAGILADAGWRLACWISAPSHIIGSHGLAILGLAAAGSLLAVAADRPRWRRLRRSQGSR